jgi:hypothetical protein
MRWIVLLSPALLYGIDCAHPENSAEKLVCTTPDLHAKQQDIDRQSAALKPKLTGEDAAILADSEMPFLRQRDDCSNQDDVRACVARILSARQDLLHRTQSDPAAIREAIAQSNYIDIRFLWKYWRQLLGRKLSVFGCISPGEEAPRTHAELEMENQHPVPLLFKSMPEEIADFLDDQKPCAHWLVTVRKEKDSFILYADDVLGRPLP